MIYKKILIFHGCYLNDGDGVSLIVARTASMDRQIIKTDQITPDLAEETIQI